MSTRVTLGKYSSTIRWVLEYQYRGTGVLALWYSWYWEKIIIVIEFVFSYTHYSWYRLYYWLLTRLYMNNGMYDVWTLWTITQNVQKGWRVNEWTIWTLRNGIIHCIVHRYVIDFYIVIQTMNNMYKKIKSFLQLYIKRFW